MMLLLLFENMQDIITRMKVYSYFVPDYINTDLITIDKFGQWNGLLLPIERKEKKGKKRRMIKGLALLFILLLILYHHHYYNNEIYIALFTELKNI